jgi:alpha-1,2-mannosyltransferase
MMVGATSAPSPRSLALQHGLLAFVPLVLTGYLIYASVTLGNFAFDFHHAYWRAAHAVLDGRGPYIAPGDRAVTENVAFVYPAVGALLVAPFALLPHVAGDIAFTLLCFAAIFGALHVLEVRDWRVYGAVLLWLPVVHAWQNANFTLPLVAGTAAMWRYRSTPVVAGALLALVVSAKLFLWPLAIWFVAARRWAALGYAAVIGVAMNLVAWGILGFDQLGPYRRLIARLDRVETPRSYSITALAMQHGVGRTTAYAASYLVAAALLAGCVVAGRRGREPVAFALAIAGMLGASPILWTHYLCFLVVPLAIMRPRLGPLWLVPVATVVCPEGNPATWRLLVALTVLMVVFTALVRRPVMTRSAPPVPPSPRPTRIRAATNARR